MSKSQTHGLWRRFTNKFNTMRFTDIAINFDVKYEGHQNCSKTFSMHILRLFGHHHTWHQNWCQYLWISLCQFIFCEPPPQSMCLTFWHVNNSLLSSGEFSTSQTELFLVSNRSISSLISWGWQQLFVGVSLCTVHCETALSWNTTTGKNTKSQLKYSLYLLLLRLVVHRWITIMDSRSYCTFT